MTDRRYNFVVFSDDWGRHPSSCQHLFARISREHRVLWVNTLGLRSAKADAFTFRRGLEKLREWTHPFRRVHDNLHVLAPVMLPMSGAGWAGRCNDRAAVRQIRQAMRRLQMRRPVFWSSLPTAAPYVGRLDEQAVVYYVTDDYATWPGSHAKQVRRADRTLTDAADVILPCTEKLAQSHQAERGTTVVLPHAVDFEHFARDGASGPRDLEAIPHPRVCFFGLIYEKIDLPALADLARARPAVQIVLIGPVATDTSVLAPLPNVHILGPRPYEVLPAYLAAMDALVIPYVLDEETAHKGPLKIRECLAAGRPIAARRIADLEPLADVVQLYDDPADLPDAVDRALAQASPEHTAALRDRARGQTWADRAAQALAEIDRVTDRAYERAGGARRGISCHVASGCEARAGEITDYAADHARGNIFFGPAWGSICHDVYGARRVTLTARRRGNLVGVLPLVFQQSCLFGAHYTSLPYFDAAGVLADDEAAHSALLAEAGRLLRGSAAQWVELRHETDLFPHLPKRTDKVTFLLDLPDDPEILWKALKAKVRSQIRKAGKVDLVAADGGRELLGEFYRQYVWRMRDLGSPPHARRFFEEILRRFGEAARVFVVRQGTLTLAASLTFRDRRALRVPWAGADREHQKLNANMLLYWAMLEHGCRTGAPAFDFGRCTVGSGTHKFKKQWGGQEQTLYWHYLLPPGQALPEIRHDSPKYRLMVAAWQRLPVPLAERIGPPIIGTLA